MRIASAASVFWILSFILSRGTVAGETGPKSKSTISSHVVAVSTGSLTHSGTYSPTRSQNTHTKASGKVPQSPSHPTEKSYGAISPTSRKSPDPSRTNVPKTSGKKSMITQPTYKSRAISPTKVLTSPSHPTNRSRGQKTPSNANAPSKKVSTRSKSQSATRSQKTPPEISKSSGTVLPTGHETRPPTTSQQKPKPTISQSGAHPTSTTKTPNASPPPASKTPRPTTTNTIHPEVKASKTLTVSNGQTASVEVGWIIVGVGAGGSVVVEGDVLPVAGGTEVIVVENADGDVVSTVSSQTPTRTSTSKSSSSSSPTASPTAYNIYPRRGSTASQKSAFTRNLESIAQPGSVRRITGVRDRLLLWVASLTPAQASELGRNPVVRALNVDRPLAIDLGTVSTSGTAPLSNCPSENCSNRKRDGTILMQRKAPQELKMFSQARGASLSALPGYAYDSMGGRGITVYVIDSGINQDHPEFRNMQGSIRWLFLPDDPETRSDDVGHGTCGTSKIAGRTFGVAKNANLVVVKLIMGGASATGSRVIEAWAAVARDIASENLQGKAVVSIAMGVFKDEISEGFKAAYRECLEDVIGLDVAVVVASGNTNRRWPGLALDTYPALFASEIPIVVVGAVQIPGVYAPYSKGIAADLTASALGKVFCASHQGGMTYRQGTSYAGPSVAGLAAYLLSLDQYRVQLQVQGSVARNVRDLIKSLAYARLPLQPAVAWNGIDSRQHPCPPAARRDAGSPECPSLDTTRPVIPPGPSHPKVTGTPSSNPLPASTMTNSLTSTFGSSVMTTGNSLPSTSSSVTAAIAPPSIAPSATPAIAPPSIAPSATPAIAPPGIVTTATFALPSIISVITMYIESESAISTGLVVSES